MLEPTSADSAYDNKINRDYAYGMCQYNVLDIKNLFQNKKKYRVELNQQNLGVVVISKTYTKARNLLKIPDMVWPPSSKKGVIAHFSLYYQWKPWLIIVIPKQVLG